jgi:hypothetical protein
MNWQETRGQLIECGINADKLPEKWQYGIDLRWADLRGADLSWARLSGADLSWADLSGARLSWAHLSWADLSGARLGGADLSWADLSNTVLDTNLTAYKRRFAKNCRPRGKNGGRIVYRSARSEYNGSTEYLPGKTYTAPYLSHDALTECHPGIYACDTPIMAREWSDSIVKCYVRDGDYVVVDKGIRCARIRVLSSVEGDSSGGQ